VRELYPDGGFSEEPMSGVRSVTLESEVVPRLPARARRFPSSLAGEHASEDDVGEAPLERA
jgi:hypothetical protein